MKQVLKKPWVRLLLKLTFIGLILWAVLSFVLGLYRMDGNSMYPAIRDGDLCVAYRLDQVHNHDVVVYRDPDGELRIGRIAAREGDTLDVDGSALLINGTLPQEEIFYPTDMSGTPLIFPIRLESGQVLILNDFRSDTQDSRQYGILSTDELQGKVILVLRIRGF